MQVRELGHLVLYVRELSVSVHFYRDVLGWRPILDGANAQMPFGDRRHLDLQVLVDLVGRCGGRFHETMLV